MFQSSPNYFVRFYFYITSDQMWLQSHSWLEEYNKEIFLLFHQLVCGEWEQEYDKT